MLREQIADEIDKLKWHSTYGLPEAEALRSSILEMQRFAANMPKRRPVPGEKRPGSPGTPDAARKFAKNETVLAALMAERDALQATARDRFVEKSFINGAWGLPTYFAAQVVLALSIAS